MHWFIYSVYVAIVGLIRVYKLIEYKVLQLCNPLLQRIMKGYLEKIGVVAVCPGDKKEEVRLRSSKFGEVIRVKVNDNHVFARIANQGAMGLGEAFMDKSLRIYDDNFEDISQLVKRGAIAKLYENYYNPWNKFLEWLELHAFNMQTAKRAFQVGKVHYDLGNDLFEIMLDPWMQYTCGYWKDATDLNQAQINKMELIAKKLNLKPGMRVLDIGCGWGTLLKYLAIRYNVQGVGVTIGSSGAAYGRQVCNGLPVDIRVQDYRNVDEKFDRIVSVGMFEHVGYRNYKTFFKIANRCLKDDGIFLLHTIGRSHSELPRCEAWTNKYIFPNGCLPDPQDITKSTKGLFVIEDWHNFGLDYAKTLAGWRENFVKGWPQIEHKFDERFFRMWVYYLSSSRGAFLARIIHLWQIVLSKDGLKEEYRAAR